MKFRFFTIFLLSFLFVLANNVNFAAQNSLFKLGIEAVTLKDVQQFTGNRSPRVGLITNHTGKDASGRRNVDVLRWRGITVTHIFAPEHGFNGASGAFERVDSATDKKTGIPIVSLYGAWSGKSIDPKILESLDLLVFDIQDAGVRYFTYVSTLLTSMENAAEHKCPFMVLDRPNPLGANMEGSLVDTSLRSFSSRAPIPVRHGMTIGELAVYFNKVVLKKPVKLQVIKMDHYNRMAGLPADRFSPLSPNIPSMKSVYGYSFLGILGEVRPLEMYVGTKQAFQYFLLPDSHQVPKNHWKDLQNKLSGWGIRSTWHQAFVPRKKQFCSGLRLDIENINKVPTFSVILGLFEFLKKAGVSVSFSRYFNNIIGTERIQNLMFGKYSFSHFKQEVNTALSQFYTRAKGAFLYSPLPVLTFAH